MLVLCCGLPLSVTGALAGGGGRALASGLPGLTPAKIVADVQAYPRNMAFDPPVALAGGVLRRCAYRDVRAAYLSVCFWAKGNSVPRLEATVEQGLLGAGVPVLEHVAGLADSENERSGERWLRARLPRLERGEKAREVRRGVVWELLGRVSARGEGHVTLRLSTP